MEWILTAVVVLGFLFLGSLIISLNKELNSKFWNILALVMGVSLGILLMVFLLSIIWL